MRCQQCDSEFDRRQGGVHKFCSNACRQKNYRARKNGKTLSARRWVRARGKRPIMPDGSPASTTNPATWSTWQEVRRSRAGDGFGYMCGGGIGAYDLDNSVSGGVIKPWAIDFIRNIPEKVLFADLSVSGRGIHVWIEAPESKGTKSPLGDGMVERYTWGRFIRMGEPVSLDALLSHGVVELKI